VRPLHHRDSFDWLNHPSTPKTGVMWPRLVALAQALNLPILSADRGLDEYDVRRVW